MTQGKMYKEDFEGREIYFIYCPGCQQGHAIYTPPWFFDKNYEKPTFSPSVKNFIRDSENNEVVTCHFFLTEGRIHYCGDCPHEYSNQIIDLVPFPENYGVPGKIVIGEKKNVDIRSNANS
jgi:hypothetical protein